MIQLRLDEKNFGDLVRGRIVEIRPEVGEPVDIMLASDIGFVRMLELLKAAIVEGATPERFLAELRIRGWSPPP